jgi:hypothetical protein
MRLCRACGLTAGLRGSCQRTGVCEREQDIAAAGYDPLTWKVAEGGRVDALARPELTEELPEPVQEPLWPVDRTGGWKSGWC